MESVASPKMRPCLIVGLRTIAIVAVALWASAECRALNVELPDELFVRLGGDSIRGWLTDFETVREAIRRTSAAAPEGATGESKVKLPPEGFAYRPNESAEQFEVMAWSDRGRTQAILGKAERALARVVRQKKIAAGEPPAGFGYNQRRRIELSKNLDESEERPAGEDDEETADSDDPISKPGKKVTARPAVRPAAPTNLPKGARGGPAQRNPPARLPAKAAGPWAARFFWALLAIAPLGAACGYWLFRRKRRDLE